MLSFAEAGCAAVAGSAIFVDVTLLASAAKRGTGLHFNEKKVLLKSNVLVT